MTSGCNSILNREKSQNNENVLPSDSLQFEEYLSTLNKIKFPFRYSTRWLPDVNLDLSHDTVKFSKYKHIWSVAALGILKRTDNYIVTVDLIIGDLG